MNVNKPDFIFEDCENCGELLTEIEKEICHRKCAETNQLHVICISCLKMEHGGEWPAITPK